MIKFELWTLDFPQLARCDTCGHKGELKQTLPLLGEVKHFCSLKCLLHFCNKHIQSVNTGMFWWPVSVLTALFALGVYRHNCHVRKKTLRFDFYCVNTLRSITNNPCGLPSVSHQQSLQQLYLQAQQSPPQSSLTSSRWLLLCLSIPEPLLSPQTTVRSHTHTVCLHRV